MIPMDNYTVLDLKNLFHTVLDHIDYAILVADKNGRYIFVNKFVLDYTETALEDWVGKTPREIINEGIYDKSVVMEAIRTGKEVSGIIHTKKGYSSLSTSRPVFDDGGSLKYVVTISVNPDRFNSLVEKLQEEKEKQSLYKQEVAHLRKTLFYDSEVVFASSDMKDLFAGISKFAPTDSTVLITGESGSGKEVIAKTIHQNSRRKEGPFIPVCIPSIPANLLESELFGYDRGAFTGSNKTGKPGLFELANNGTLFLDELGDIPYELQVKILRVLDTLEVTRVGSVKPKKLNIRIIAATNKNIYDMAKAGLFREDLLYRLSIIHLHIKPLRERVEDITALAEHFIEKINKKYGYEKKITKQACRVLRSYSWPGNVRELRNVIERCCIMSDNKTITEEEIINILGVEINMPQSGQKPHHHRDASLINEFKSLERTKIMEALIESKGNKSMAAKALGISRSKLYRKLEETHPEY